MVEKGRFGHAPRPFAGSELPSRRDSVAFCGDAARVIQILERADAARRALGFLSLEATAALADRGVLIPDPSSTLVSPEADLGEGVVLWPGTVLQVRTGGSLLVGAGAVLSSGTRIVADAGRVTIGSDAEIGQEGGFTVMAEAGATIAIGRGARLLGGGSLMLTNEIGDGGQILGPIRCQHCRLASGGTHREPDPDLRGGVLKGAGVARNLDVPRGQVIQAFGLFAEAPLRRQSEFHPKAQG